ncbi:sugar transferase [Microbacterium sp. MC2]
MHDTAIVGLACLLASLASLPVSAPQFPAGDAWLWLQIPLSTIVLWVLTLSLFNSREPAIMGSGPVEYARVVHATGFAFGVLAILGAIFEWPGIRPQLLYALPVGLVALVASRWILRRWLIAQRSVGRYTSRTVVVGMRDDVEYAIRTLGSEGRLGYNIVGTVILDEVRDRIRVDEHVYPVVRGADAGPRAASVLGADTIIVAGQPSGDPNYVKRLAWELEETAAELVLSSRIADVAGPRMSLRPVEGLPLIHVRIPTFDGGVHFVKRALDILVSLFAVVLFAPIAAIVAVAIKWDSPGPVFFHQSRVGRDGKEFKMLKFRSMTVGAETQQEALLTANEGAGPLFKLRDDPRVTRVGQFLRRYSLDELPQFWNVLKGEMSVVGPRPPLPSEVASYQGPVSRRLYIKPGITGPWQVGGRSDLTWEESVRLDLRYVENWSVLSDIVLMWRTAKVMITAQGAY